MMITKGLSAQQAQSVEKFDSQMVLIDNLVALRDLLSNPKALKDLADRKLEAIQITDQEEKKRLDALTTIAKGDELRKLAAELERRGKELDQTHEDDLAAIEQMKADAKRGFDEREQGLLNRDNAIKQAEADIDKKKLVAQENQRSAESKLNERSAQLDKREQTLNERESGLNDLQRKIEEVKSALR